MMDGEVPREKISRGEAFIDKLKKCLQEDTIVLRQRKNLTFIHRVNVAFSVEYAGNLYKLPG